MTAPAFFRGNGAYALAMVALAALTVYFAYTGKALVEGRARLHAKNAEFSEYTKMEADFRSKTEAFAPYKERLASAEPVLMPGALVAELARKVGADRKLKATAGLALPEREGYREAGVSMKLAGLSLNELVNLLYRIDGQKGLMMVKSFSVNRSAGEGLFDVEMEVVQAVRIAEGGTNR